MGGRIIAGIGQLILTLAGFALITAWFIQLWFGMYRNLMGDTNESPRIPWLGQAGAITFIASWLWSLVTSLSLLREARRNAADKPA